MRRPIKDLCYEHELHDWCNLDKEIVSDADRD